MWYGGDPEGALVQFATPFEARKAHDSAEAVLNNRFIKIYYLRRDTYPPPQQPREQQIEVYYEKVRKCQFFPSVFVPSFLSG